MATTQAAPRIAYSADVARSPELAPVSPEERIDALDVLRGWAMFGVLWSNLNDWYGTTDPATPFDSALQWTQNWLLESRFYTLLCFLFGAGFGIQLLRSAERGVDVKATYYRRTLALLGIGLVHGWLIWSGDILVMYALVAFALVMFRTVSARGALIAAAVSWFLAPEIIVRVRILAGQAMMVPGSPSVTSDWVLGHGTWLQIAPIRAAGVLNWFGRWGLTSYFSILAMFLVGFWAVKSGFLRRLAADPRAVRRLLMWSVIAALVGLASDVWLSRIWRPHAVPPTGITDPYFWYPRRLVLRVVSWSTEGAALAYASLLLLGWHTSAGKRLLRPLAATGRMALTTYLTQSVVCTLLFMGYGFGRYGTVGYTGMLELTVVLFALQMIASTWWLARFRFGPVEWLWRTLTYGRAPQFRVAPASTALATSESELPL